MPILWLIVAALLMYASYEDARTSTENKFHKACVSKYSDMPYNQVTAYCTKLLKFEKDEK